MSKFCKDCGFELEDGALFCVNCGAPVDEESYDREQPSKAGSFADAEQGKKIGKIIKCIFIAAVVIAAVAVVGNTVYKFTGYRGLMRKVMKAYENYDIDKLISLSSDMYYYDDGELAKNYFEYTTSSGLDVLDSNIGHNYKFTYKIKDACTLSGRQEIMVLDRIKRNYPDFDEDSIKKIVVVEVKATAKKNKRTSTLNLQFTLSKESGKWKLLFID